MLLAAACLVGASSFADDAAPIETVELKPEAKTLAKEAERQVLRDPRKAAKLYKKALKIQDDPSLRKKYAFALEKAQKPCKAAKQYARVGDSAKAEALRLKNACPAVDDEVDAGTVLVAVDEKQLKKIQMRHFNDEATFCKTLPGGACLLPKTLTVKGPSEAKTDTLRARLHYSTDSEGFTSIGLTVDTADGTWILSPLAQPYGNSPESKIKIKSFTYSAPKMPRGVKGEAQKLIVLEYTEAPKGTPTRGQIVVCNPNLETPRCAIGQTQIKDAAVRVKVYGDGTGSARPTRGTSETEAQNAYLLLNDIDFGVVD